MADENVNNKNAAKNAARSAEIKKQKKKKWVPIIAPEMFGSRVIGESLVDDATQLMNRAITVNMAQLTGDMKKQNTSLMFKVVDIKEGKAFTIPAKFEIGTSSIKRLAKREKDKLSDSFVVKTVDNKLVRIKPLMVTNNMTKGSVSAALIKTCRVVCKEVINKLTFDVLINDLVNNKFQREIRDMLHTTYPLRIFEIRMLTLETKKKKETVEDELLAKVKKQKEAKEAEKRENEELEQKHTNQADETSPSQSEATEDQSNDSEDEDSSDEDSDDQ